VAPRDDFNEVAHEVDIEARTVAIAMTGSKQQAVVTDIFEAVQFGVVSLTCPRSTSISHCPSLSLSRPFSLSLPLSLSPFILSTILPSLLFASQCSVQSQLSNSVPSISSAHSQHIHSMMLMGTLLKLASINTTFQKLLM
jgi:hypothetical protein